MERPRAPYSVDMEHYTTSDVARIFSLSPGRIRRMARSDLLDLQRGPHNEYLYTFQDLVLIRTALELEAARVPPRRVHRALKELRNQLPANRPLSAVRIAAEGDRVVVHDGPTVWQPESGQVQFDFSVADLALHADLTVRGEQARRGDQGVSGQEIEAAAPPIHESGNGERSAADWYELAVDHESSSPQLAQELYRRAIEVDPSHADALVNLGCLLHEDGELERAQAYYLRALEANPRHATAAFNLGVVLEDLGSVHAALEAYLVALAIEPGMADAHYNLSSLFEATGDRAGALRHLRSYRELTRSS